MYLFFLKSQSKFIIVHSETYYRVDITQRFFQKKKKDITQRFTFQLAHRLRD